MSSPCRTRLCEMPGMTQGRTLPLSWVSRDGRIIILARSVRTFAQGSIAVLFAVYLDLLGFTLTQIGVFFSFGVAGAALFSFLVSLIAEKVGRRRMMVGLTLMTAAAGAVLVVTDDVVVLTAFAFLGTLSGVGGGGGAQPTQPLEQASLADASPPARRTDLFAVYGIASTGAAAVGALAAGLPEVLQSEFGAGELGSFKAMFVAFVALLLVVALLYSLLSPGVEVRAEARHWVNPLTLPSRRIIFTLTALFSVDNFAGSLLLQSLVAYWFSTRFGLELGALALVFFFSQVLAATSLWLAARIAARIGLINTMVFTHIPANLFLISAAFAPSAALAVVFWQLRSFLGQMDVPTRTSYIMAVVGPEERVAMASIHIVGRSVSGIGGPTVATALWQAVSASAPLIGCAVLKIAYDLALFFMFRNVKPPEEAERAAERAASSSG